jgi:hypothetical protein
MWAKKCKVIAIAPKNLLSVFYLHFASQYDLDYTLLPGSDISSNDDFEIDKNIVIEEILTLIPMI